MFVFEERGKPQYPEKIFSDEKANQQQTQLKNGVNAGIRTRATLVEGECSHHCVTQAPEKRKTFISSSSSLQKTV